MWVLARRDEHVHLHPLTADLLNKRRMGRDRDEDPDRLGRDAVNHRSGNDTTDNNHLDNLHHRTA